MKNTIENPIKWARFAGLLYLLIAITGGFSIGYVPTQIIVENNAIETAQHFLENQGLFRLGITGDILVFIMEVILTVILYHLLKSVSDLWANIAKYARFAMAIVMGINLMFYVVPFMLLTNTVFLEGFTLIQLQELSLLFFEIHAYGIFVWQLFFALHLLILGYLVIKADFFPSVLGQMMMIGGIGYALDSVMELTLIENTIISYVAIVGLTMAVIGELSFTFYLLFKGMKIKEKKHDV